MKMKKNLKELKGSIWKENWEEEWKMKIEEMKVEIKKVEKEMGEKEYEIGYIVKKNEERKKGKLVEIIG